MVFPVGPRLVNSPNWSGPSPYNWSRPNPDSSLPVWCPVRTGLPQLTQLVQYVPRLPMRPGSGSGFVPTYSIIDGRSSLFNALRRAPIGVSLEQLHWMFVEVQGVSEEFFFLAYQAARLSILWSESDQP